MHSRNYEARQTPQSMPPLFVQQLRTSERNGNSVLLLDIIIIITRQDRGHNIHAINLPTLTPRKHGL
jgi:hypothetical protein